MESDLEPTVGTRELSPTSIPTASIASIILASYILVELTVIADDTSVLLASTAGSVVLMWDVETGKCIRSYNLEGAPVRFARFGQGHEEAFYIIDASVGNAFSTLVIFDVKEFKRDGTCP